MRGALGLSVPLCTGVDPLEQVHLLEDPRPPNQPPQMVSHQSVSWLALLDLHGHQEASLTTRPESCRKGLRGVGPGLPGFSAPTIPFTPKCYQPGLLPRENRPPWGLALEGPG